MSTSKSRMGAWGNGRALRLPGQMTTTAGVAEVSPARVADKPGRIVIEADVQPTLEQMLAAFDP
jgi:antitoxin MazE